MGEIKTPPIFGKIDGVAARKEVAFYCFLGTEVMRSAPQLGQRDFLKRP